MSSIPSFDMIDATQNQLEQALRVCGLPLTLHSDAFQEIAETNWHTTYRVTVPQHAQPFVIRIRRQHNQNYKQHANDWHAEYVSTSLYYMQANRAEEGICPDMFLYHVSEELTCTVETHMGKRLQLANLDRQLARRLGRQIGRMMHNMHQKKTHINGAGEIAWDGANLYGEDANEHTILAHTFDRAYKANILMALTEQGPSFGHQSAQAKLRTALQIRDVEEPIVLINRDITPEHLTIQTGNRVGIIDPYPYLGQGTRFAAWFIHCYRFLLPAYARTTRHQPKRYDVFANMLAEIASGFEQGYIQGDLQLAQHITAERWMWTLEQAYDDLERLQKGTLTRSEMIKHGTPGIIRRRLKKAVRELESLDF